MSVNWKLNAAQTGRSDSPKGLSVRAAANRHPAFTLIELLVVIAIIAILAAILLPVFAATRERARRNACSSNLSKIGNALELYRQDQGGYPQDLWSAGASTPALAYHAGLLVLLGKGSPYAIQNPTDYLNKVPAYLDDISTLRCPDNPIADRSNVSLAAATAPFGSEGYDNYDGPDPYAAAQTAWNTAGPNPVSTRKYSLFRLPGDDFGNASATSDSANADFTRQLKFQKPDPDTVVTWCTAHRPRINGVLTPPDGGKSELVLFLDGKVAVKHFVNFAADGAQSVDDSGVVTAQAVTGNGLRTETAP